MFKKFTNGCVNVVNRWLPDAFLFAVILTIVVFIAAMVGTGQGPIQVLAAWGNSSGFWQLLSFSMQMALVLVLGSTMASAPVFVNFLDKIASKATGPKSAIIITVYVTSVCMWLNWGLGLVAGALLAMAVARKVPNVDYRLLIASAYAPITIWHAGLSGSIPLTLSGGYTVGTLTLTAPLTATIFHPMNLIMVIATVVIMPFILFAQHPEADKIVTVDPARIAKKEVKVYTAETPADKIEQSKILWAIMVIAGIGYFIYYAVTVGLATLGLNQVNFLFLFLGLLMHGSLRRYLDAFTEAASGAAGVLLQFPFYAGIMGMMVAQNADGVSLASMISNFFVRISTEVTFPMLTFLSAGIVNFFVPSGGGQWAVQGPIVMPAAEAMGVEAGRAAMAIAWGDHWTNLIQPFWALPALGIAGLSARDIMGYLVTVLIFVGIVACLGFLAWAMFF